MDSVTNLAEISLHDPDGAEVRLGDIITRPTIIIHVRYYGCAPCIVQLKELSSRYDEIRASGAEVVGVGPRAAYQARILTRRRHIAFPLLLDADHRVAAAFGLKRQSLLRFVFDVTAWWRWLRAFVRSGQGVITGGWWEVPAIAAVDAKGEIAWVHRGRSIGDYPPLSDVLDHLTRVLQTGKE